MVSKLESGGEFPFDFGKALNSMRASGHSFTSSIAEAIDNSIGHGDATEMHLLLSWLERKNKHDLERLKQVVIIDNGNGMNKEVLSKCLVLGFSTTYGERSGIGRFGFGLTAGALSQCRRIEIYSKTKGSDSYYVVLDLDEFLNGKEKINPAVKKEIPKEYSKLIKHNGTVVIWNYLDIAGPFDSKNDLEHLFYDLGRIYRKFIGLEIVENNKSNPNKKRRKIFINREEVKPFDPLYHTKIPGFEKDSRSELLWEKNIELPIHPAEGLDNSFKKDKVTIRMSLLPKEWRKIEGRGGEDFPGRWIEENEGISILRNNREVYYGPVRGIGPVRDPKDRWWGMEISFPATLDHWFSVKNIKVGAVPIKEAKKRIDDLVSHTIKTCRERVQNEWIKTSVGVKKDKTENPYTTGHEEVEDAFKKAGVGKPSPEQEGSPEEKEKIWEQLSERFGNLHEELSKEKLEELNVKWINEYDIDERSPFIDINPQLGITIIGYNIKHIFFQRWDEMLQKLKKLSEIRDKNEFMKAQDEIAKSEKELTKMIDLLLGAYAGAHASLNPYAKQEVRTTLLSLLSRWSEYLRIVTAKD